MPARLACGYEVVQLKNGSPLTFSILLQKGFEFGNGPPAVADGIFFFNRHLCESPVVAFRHEYGVITEASSAFFDMNDLPVYDSLKSIFLAIEDKRDNCSEAGVAVFHSFEVAEQQAHVGLGIPCRAGITGGVNPRGSVQGFDLQPGVFGKTIRLVMLVDVAGFLQCIAFQGGAGLRKFLPAADLIQSDDLEGSPESGIGFFNFVGVSCGKNDWRHIIIYGVLGSVNSCLRFFHSAAALGRAPAFLSSKRAAREEVERKDTSPNRTGSLRGRVKCNPNRAGWMPNKRTDSMACAWARLEKLMFSPVVNLNRSVSS